MRETEARGSIKIEIIPGDYKYVRLLENFWFYSDVLQRWCMIPKFFVFDLESVPVVRGTNPESGAIHDYLCRSDSDPIVDKDTAARVYEEFQEYYDDQEPKTWYNSAWDWLRRLVKTEAVEVASGYFHKHKVMAYYEELVGEKAL